MVTEQVNLNFRYFCYLCIIGVTKHDGIYSNISCQSSFKNAIQTIIMML